MKLYNLKKIVDSTGEVKIVYLQLLYSFTNSQEFASPYSFSNSEEFASPKIF